MKEFMMQYTEALIMYFLALVLAFWGGVSKYLFRLRRTQDMRFKLAELISESVTSSFSGIVCALLTQEYITDSFIVILAVAGLAGHAGGRALFIVESLVYEARNNGNGPKNN